MDLGVWIGIFQGACTLLAGAGMLRMLYLHKQEFQMLKSVIWRRGYITPPRRMELEFMGLRAPEHAG